jgi:hypothetical protein
MISMDVLPISFAEFVTAATGYRNRQLYCGSSIGGEDGLLPIDELNLKRKNRAAELQLTYRYHDGVTFTI